MKIKQTVKKGREKSTRTILRMASLSHWDSRKVTSALRDIYQV